jgi:hypothetical protein
MVAGNSMHWTFKLSPNKTLITGTYPAAIATSMDHRQMQRFDFLGFGRQGTWHHLLLTVPHWFPVALSIAVGYWTPLFVSFARAAVARIPSRFSLRTLLIATALIAVVLGIIVWLR